MAAKKPEERKDRGMNFHSPCSLFSFAARHRFLFSRSSSISRLILLCLSAFTATAQTNPPPASYVRSYVNDVPNQPLVTVSVYGASNVSCMTIEETLPSPASAVSISGDGVYLPAQNVIRWGPYFNTTSASVSYRLTGLPASYPVSGGSWMDGQWYFSPGVTMVTVLPSGGSYTLAPPPQLPAPEFIPPSGASTPVTVFIGYPGWDFGLLDDTWATGVRTNQNFPKQSAWFVSANSTNSTVGTNAFNIWNGPSVAVVNVTYFTPGASAPVSLGVGDTLKATLKMVLTGVAPANSTPGLRLGFCNFTDSNLSTNHISADGFSSQSHGYGVRGYCLFQNMGQAFNTSNPVDLRSRTNIYSFPLLGTASDFGSLGGTAASNNFAGFNAGRQYILTLTLNRMDANSLVFGASWLDTVTGGTFSKTATNGTETDFNFDSFVIRSQTGNSSATNITLNEFKMDYIPAAVNGIQVPTNAVFYYTLDGTVPTTNSMLYTNGIQLASAGVVRASAYATNWTPSVAAVGYYGPPALPAAAQVTRSVNTNSPTAPMVTFSVTPGTNAACIAVTESLPPGLGASNVTAGGSYIASNNVVLWGPFFGTNAQTLSYQAVGQPGTYPVQASWSVDGVGGTETTGTNIVIASATGNLVPTPPPQVAAPFFLPTSGTNVPVSVTVTDPTPGAVIYYTLDGSLPTQSSLLYTGNVSLVTASAIRAVAFTNGWLPSVASVAYYGPPAVPANAQVSRSINTSSPTAPVVTFSVTPGASAQCVAVTETLPPGVGAINLSSGGNYIASNNVVKWGPFFGTNALALSYQAVGQPGVYPVSAAWSVDGVGGAEATGTNLVIASGTGGIIPTPPQQVPMPVLTPALASNLPVIVAISDSDGAAQIYYTTDGTLPTPSAPPYTGTLVINTRTTLRAVAFHSGYLPSVSAVGEYVPAVVTYTVSGTHGVSGNGSFLPTVSLMATPQSAVNCYAVVEPIPTGLTPSGLSGDGIWDPIASVIRWGPYLDNQARYFSFNVGGASGSYPLAGQISYNGYSAGTAGASSVQINANYIGSDPATNLAACATTYLTYNVNINPAPGVVTVTSASGTVNWGDGTQSPITQPVMSLQKAYSAAGSYSIQVAADWMGYAGAVPVSGHATKTDAIQTVTNCTPPQITTQPSNQVVLAGATVQFNVSAASSVPMTYQWYFNTNFPIFSPSTFSSLTLSTVAPPSAGGYSVIITNAFGNSTSRVAALTVVTPLVTNIVKSTNGRVTLNFVGLPNATTRLWATTNLSSPASWQPIFTNTTTSTNGTWQFTDTNAVGKPARFYRFSTP